MNYLITSGPTAKPQRPTVFASSVAGADAGDGIAGFSARGLVELGEDALKALDLRFARSITGSRPQRSKAQAERRRHA